MLLRKIYLKNIRSYSEAEIIFPEGSTLLSGDIGSGKTSVLLGIEFAIFGLQPGQKGNAILRNDVKEGGVKLEFEINGKEIIVERSLKRAKAVSQDSCSISIDGEKKELAVTELKNIVLDLLNYPPEFSKKQNLLYKFTVYTPQEEMKQIILQDPETRINTIRHIFGIDKYKKILVNTSILTSKLREEKRLKEGMISNLENDKIELESKKDEINIKKFEIVSAEKNLIIKSEDRIKLQNSQEDFSKKIDEKRKLEQEIEKTNIMIINKRELISNNNITIKDLTQQIESLSSYLFDETKIMSLEKEKQSYYNDINKSDEENLIISSQINSIKGRIDELIPIKNNISHMEMCPTCLQNVSNLYKTNVLNRIENDIINNNKKLNLLISDKSKIRDRINNLKNLFSEKDKEIGELKILKIRLQGVEEKKKRIMDLQKNNLLLKKDIDMLESSVEVLKSSIFHLRKYDLLFIEKQKQIDIALKEERFAEIKVAELRKEIDLINIQINDMGERIKNTEEIKKKLHYIMELESWLSDKFVPMISFIERNVMAKLKSEFSDLFNKWFCMLVSDNFIVKIDENFTPIIEHQDYEIAYEYLSGGERTAVALAYRLSLNQVINSVLSNINTKDIVILDEPTDGFSDQQLDKMREVLMQLNVKQLLLVSHEPKIESFVENVIRFKKENGISRPENLSKSL